MPKEEKYALYKIGRPEDTFPKLTRHAYCMTPRVIPPMRYTVYL